MTVLKSGWTGGTELTSPSEAEHRLAVAVHRREAGSFERFVTRFEAGLLNYCDKVLGSRFDAQEVVQDTFLRAHDALTRQYDATRVADLAVKPWLFRIARNLSLNKRRSKRSRLDEPLSSFDDGRIGPLVPTASVTAPLEEREEREALERALGKLPSSSRELIVLRFMEEMSYADIAKTVGAEETVLRGRVFRSLKLLRDALSRPEVSR